MLTARAPLSELMSAALPAAPGDRVTRLAMDHPRLDHPGLPRKAELGTARGLAVSSTLNDTSEQSRPHQINCDICAYLLLGPNFVLRCGSGRFLRGE
jgi:hypothetical protein